MAANKFLTNVLTGSAIIASLGSSTYAGFRVFANASVEKAVPEISTPNPSFEPSPTPTLNPLASNTPKPSTSTKIELDETIKDSSNDDIVIPSVVPSSVPNSSVIPAPSSAPVTQLGDDDHDDEDELEHEDSKEVEIHDAEKIEKMEDHDDR